MTQGQAKPWHKTTTSGDAKAWFPSMPRRGFPLCQGVVSLYTVCSVKKKHDRSVTKGGKAAFASRGGSSRKTLPKVLSQLIELLRNGEDARAFFALHPEAFEDQTETLLVGLSEECRHDPLLRLAVEQTRFVLKRSREIGLDGALKEHGQSPDQFDILEFAGADSAQEQAEMVARLPGLLSPFVDDFIELMESDASNEARRRYQAALVFLRKYRTSGREGAVGKAVEKEGEQSRHFDLVSEFLSLTDADAAEEFAQRHPIVLTEEAEHLPATFEKAAAAAHAQELVEEMRHHLRYLRACREHGVRTAFREVRPFGPGMVFGKKIRTNDGETEER
jgi:hypothetical protein